jgi:hypothetical protein
MGDPVNRPVALHVGDDIPECRVMTVEIQYPERLQQLHDEQYAVLFEQLDSKPP